MPALDVLRKLQVGIEATPGVAVPATWQMVGDALWTPQQDRYFADYPRGVRAEVTDGGVPLWRGTTGQNIAEIGFEDLVYPLSTGIATPVITGTTPKTWTFTPILTGNPVNKTFTAEYVETDGATNFYAAKAPYCFTTGFDLEFAFNQITRITWRFMGRRATTGITPTPVLTPLTGREVMPANQFQIFIDDTWAGLGNTQLAGTVRSGKLTVDTGILPDYTLDGRADLDFTQLLWGNPVKVTLQLVMEVNASVATEITNWQNQDAGGGSKKFRFVRLSSISPNTIPTASHRKAQFDVSMIYAKEPVFSTQNKIRLATMDLRSEYDPVSANLFLPILTLSLATLT